MKAFSQLAAKCGDVETTFDWGCKSNDTAILDTIIFIFNMLSIGVVTIVIVFVVVGAIQYMTGSKTGEDNKTASGIGTIKNAILALGLYLIMWSLLNYLVPGGVFKS
jgi:heme/copper-type cytochrome/quinol oxidase subunit 2